MADDLSCTTASSCSTAAASRSAPSSRCPRPSPPATGFPPTPSTGSARCCSRSSPSTGPRASSAPGTRARRPSGTRSTTSTRRSVRTCRTRSRSSGGLLPELMEAFGIANLVQARLRGRRHPRHAGGGGQAAGRRVHRRHRRPRRDAGGRRRHLGDEHRPRRHRRQDLHAGRRASSASASRRRRSPTIIGLKGDSTDNIPGVPGVGEKTAAQLLQQFGSHRRAVRAPGRGQEREAARAARRARGRRAALEAAGDHGAATCRSRRTSSSWWRSGGYRLPVEHGRRGLRALRVRQPAAAPARDGTGEAAARRRRRAAEPRRAAACGSRRAGRRPAGRAAREGGGRDRLRAARRRRRPRRRRARRRRGVPGRRRPTPAAPALWLLAAHVVVHDAKAQPGYVPRPRGRPSTPRVAAYLLAPERPEKERTCSRSPAPRTAPQLVEGPAAEAAAATRAVLTWHVAEAQRPRLDRARPRAAVPRDRAAAGARARADGGRRRQDRPVPAGRDHGARARPRRRAPRRDLRGWPAASSPSARRSSSPRCCSSRLGLDARHARARPATPPTPACCAALRDAAPDRAGSSRSGASSPSCSTPTSSRCRPASTRAPAACTPPSTRRWPPPAGSRAPTRTCRTSRCAPSSARRSARASSPRRAASSLVADYSQIELRLMAQLRRGAGAARRLPPRRGRAPRHGRRRRRHRRWRRSRKTQRERAKATNFGIMYGLSAFGLSEQVDIPVEEAQAFIDAYFAKYPQGQGVPRARDRRRPTQDGYVTTLFGRRRAVPGAALVQLPRALAGRAPGGQHRAAGHRRRHHQGGHGHRAAASSSGARLASRLVLQVHDELVVECPDDEVEACRPLLREAMCGAYDDGPAARGRRRRRRRTGWRRSSLTARRQAPRQPRLRAPACYTPRFGPLRSAGRFPSVNDGPHT